MEHTDTWDRTASVPREYKTVSHTSSANFCIKCNNNRVLNIIYSRIPIIKAVVIDQLGDLNLYRSYTITICYSLTIKNSIERGSI